jgi:tetratricopeptide (TPR) repeat protein
MDSNLAQDAISAALCEDWEKAIKLNSSILKENPANINALNRLARAYAETGNTIKAKTLTKKVLKLDPANMIALRCIEKWDNFKKAKKVNPSEKGLAKIFIEEPTKTKIISLINLGDPSSLINLDCGETVKLVAHPHTVSILSMDDVYIGRFPDNLAIKFINLIKLGSNFKAIVKSTSKTEVKILVYTSKNDS